MAAYNLTANGSTTPVVTTGPLVVKCRGSFKNGSVLVEVDTDGDGYESIYVFTGQESKRFNFPADWNLRYTLVNAGSGVDIDIDDG